MMNASRLDALANSVSTGLLGIIKFVGAELRRTNYKGTHEPQLDVPKKFLWRWLLMVSLVNHLFSTRQVLATQN
jgi:hypothetical protein